MKNNNRTRNTLQAEHLKSLVLVFNETIYPTERMVTGLSNDTGLTRPQVKNWFYNRRRRLRRKRSKSEDRLTQLCEETSYQISTERMEPSYGGYAHSSYPSPHSQNHDKNKVTLPPIAVMFPNIFNEEYDYTLPPHVHPINISNPL
ncbi:hypothetical protein C8R41DRAFT_915966 [Lentinula lateritia]|uniref:Homeobox domain-containing protein n=1 Tax=Lentinula lateritia TaxID=40482 RepID=A0ABQ8VR87_9AGAR|nr:hypothetical protein C8R41DRAFT_915966 [Lentinula lateritia]